MQDRPHALPSSLQPSARRPQPLGFGRLLRKHRLRVGYSQEHLAERARVSSETIGALERGTRRAPYADTVELVIDALELAGEERLAFETAAAEAHAQQTDRKTRSGQRASLLPSQLTPLVGREDDIDKLISLVTKQRLVTVTGSSGVGKSRVVQDLAARHACGISDAVCLVDFAAHEVNASVDVKVASAIRESGTCVTSMTDLGTALERRTLLLIFDNCEHVLSETSAAALSLIRSCAGVRLLIGSSERLGVPGEILFRLSPLLLPDHVPASIEEAHRYPALSLFIKRAEAQSNVVIRAEDLQQSVQICRRLDGVPRAIELAGARLAALGFENLLLRLNERLVLTGGGRDLPKRKRALREAIDWSYTCLSTVERILFCRVAIFSAGFTLEDAERVCAKDIARAQVAELIDSLVHKSLIVVKRSNLPNSYRMLESLRTYGLEKLAESCEWENCLPPATR